MVFSFRQRRAAPASGGLLERAWKEAAANGGKIVRLIGASKRLS